MAENEFELISWEKIKHLNVFLNHIVYRNHHFHGAFELLLVLEGAGKINLPGESIPVGAGSLVFLNPNEAHEIDAQGGHLVAAILQISRHFCRDYFPELGSTKFQYHDLTAALGEEPALLEELRQRVCRVARSYLEEGPCAAFSCVSQIAALFALLLERLPHARLSGQDRTTIRKRVRRMNRLLGYVEEHYTELIRLTDLAKTEGLTPTYVSHLFSGQLGITFQEYLSNLRFEHALNLLHNTAMTVSEAALSSGFSDLKYLNKMMRQRLGCSARTYCQELTQRLPQPFHPSRQPLLERRLGPEEALECLREFCKEKKMERST